MVDGISLEAFQVGQCYEVGTRIGALLLAEGWAEPAEFDAPAPVAPVSADTAPETLWMVGDLRCVLVRLPHTQIPVVQVVRGADVVCAAWIDDPVEIEACAAAARLKAIFADGSP